MSEQQKTPKPIIEDAILELVKEEHKQAALEFAGYIRSNKMTPAWEATNAWKYNYKGKRVGYFRITADGDWLLPVFAQYDTCLNELISDESEEIAAFVKDQVGNYIPCGGCMPGLDRRTVTKEAKNICGTTSIRMTNPDELYREFAKRLIALRRDAILDGRVPKCNYIKPADRT